MMTQGVWFYRNGIIPGHKVWNKSAPISTKEKNILKIPHASLGWVFLQRKWGFSNVFWWQKHAKPIRKNEIRNIILGKTGLLVTLALGHGKQWLFCPKTLDESVNHHRHLALKYATRRNMHPWCGTSKRRKTQGVISRILLNQLEKNSYTQSNKISTLWNRSSQGSGHLQISFFSLGWNSC